MNGKTIQDKAEAAGPSSPLPGRSSAPAGIYALGQIARAADMLRQAVVKGLEGVAPGGQIDLDGKAAQAWTFESLPMEWKLEITRRGMKRGFENGERFLASLRLTPWQPRLPWAQVPTKEQEKARQLQKALARALALRGDPEAEAGQVERIGMHDFKAEFGYAVSARHWHRLFNRTIDRDGGEENWARPEIYLDDRALAVRKPARETAANEYRHRALDDVIAVLQDRQDPSSEDRSLLWDAVFGHYEEHMDALTDSPQDNRERRVFKRSLLKYLFKIFPGGTLCATWTSLKRRFDEKLAEWRANGRNPRAIRDNRAEESGRTGRKLCPHCRPIVIGAAVDLDGDLSQAWRRLQLAGKLCSECAAIGSFDVRRAKSEVPKSVRKDVTPDIETALPSRRGPKHMRLVSPCVRRTWSDIGPGDFAECDDMTPNHVTHGAVDMLTWDLDRQGHSYLGRMEVLFQADRRTDYPWAYLIILGDPATALTPQRKATYNSVHCRLLILRGHDQLGLPHLGGGFVLENGVWRSRLIDGSRLQHWNSSPWRNVELGLRDPRISLAVHHALPGNPRTKIIERIFLAVQNRMRCQPGFVGFNERDDKREVLADFIRRVKAGKEHPGNEVPAVSVFRKLFDDELMAFASEPQNGERLPGVSPMEAMHNGIDGRPGIKDRPLRQLGPEARFLLSSHERLVTVGRQGISFEIGGCTFNFWGEELEPFQHRPILTRINLEEPELLICQPPDGNPFAMRARILPSTTATKEQLAATGRDRASWVRRGKVIYDNLPHPLRTNITRDNEQSGETSELGRFHNEELEKLKAEKAKAARQTGRARQEAAQAGFDTTHLRLKNPERVAEAAARIADRFAALRAKEA